MIHDSDSIILLLKDRELLLLLNSVHERAMRMLDMSLSMAGNEYIGPLDRKPTKEDVKMMYDGHHEHLSIVEKLQNIHTLRKLTEQKTDEQ